MFKIIDCRRNSQTVEKMGPGNLATANTRRTRKMIYRVLNVLELANVSCWTDFRARKIVPLSNRLEVLRYFNSQGHIDGDL